MEKTVVLKAKRDKPVRQGHPWIFSGAIASITRDVIDGDIVSVVDSDHKWLAKGYLNRASQIQVRLLSWDEAEQIDDAFWERRLVAAVQRRTHLAESSSTNAYRLVNAESDFLPGLTVDRYGDYLVMQVGTLGIEIHKQKIAQTLLDLTDSLGIIERDDVATRRKEKLPQSDGLVIGEAPSGLLTIKEASLVFTVDLMDGQKTGFYLDQRENRRRIAGYCSEGRVLNAFSYTGAIAVHALAAGAQHVTNIDTSVRALEIGEENLKLNGFDPDTMSESLVGDVFDVLRDWRDFGPPALPNSAATEDSTANLFDVIVLDPPKFAQSKGQVDKALRGYKDINLLAMQLLKPNGILATFSCSGLVSADLFQKVVFGAAVDAGRSVQILEWRHQPSDHPVAITFPEGSYLKGLLCRVL